MNQPEVNHAHTRVGTLINFSGLFPSPEFKTSPFTYFFYKNKVKEYLKSGFDVKALRAFKVISPLRLVSGVPSKSHFFQSTLLLRCGSRI